MQKAHKSLSKSIIGSGEPIPDDKTRDNTGNHKIPFKTAVKNAIEKKKELAKIVKDEKKEK